jgi:hypothetical protein
MIQRRHVQWALGSTALVFSLMEGAVRLSGITDFPVYSLDDTIAYLPTPNQSGSFLRTNSWEFNDRSMGVKAPWTGTHHPNLLLIGNSIFMGGNPFAQEEKLGPLLQQELGPGAAVWPIAAGRWSTVNEIAYLRKNPDVIATADFFVWEYMSGGLNHLAPWQGELLFPTEKPLWATSYVARRYIAPRLLGYSLIEQQPNGPPTAENLAAFMEVITKLCQSANGKARGVILLYPDARELSLARQRTEWLPDRDALAPLAKAGCVTVLDLAERPEWSETDYRDGVHPTAEGNRALAKILASAVRT